MKLVIEINVLFTSVPRSVRSLIEFKSESVKVMVTVVFTLSGEANPDPSRFSETSPVAFKSVMPV